MSTHQTCVPGSGRCRAPHTGPLYPNRPLHRSPGTELDQMGLLEMENHDDVIKWKHFPRNWPFVREIPRYPVNSPHKGQWRGALVFSLICVWINDWVNNREAGDLRRYPAHSDVIVMNEVHELVRNSCSDVKWASRHLNSSATRQFVQHFVHVENKGNVWSAIGYMVFTPPIVVWWKLKILILVSSTRDKAASNHFVVCISNFVDKWWRNGKSWGDCRRSASINRHKTKGLSATSSHFVDFSCKFNSNRHYIYDVPLNSGTYKNEHAFCSC